MSKLPVVLAALLSFTPFSSRATELFSANASNGFTVVSSADSNFVSMVETTMKRLGSLSFAGRPFTANLTYMGSPTGISITQDYVGYSARFRLKSTGFDETFTGTSLTEVRRKIERFLKTEGTAIVAKLNDDATSESAFAISDGNPAATTASAARTVFFSQGIPLTNNHTDNGASARSTFGTGSLAVSRTHLEADIAGRTYQGEQLRVDGSLASLRLNNRMRIELPVTGEFTDIEGTEILGGGATLAVPIRIIIPAPGHPLGWKLAPVFGLHTRASTDAATGGISRHAGLVSVADWRFNERFTLGLINQVTTHQSFVLEVAGYTLDAEVDQTILKNGLCLTTRLTSGLHSNLYLIDTRFMKEASIDAYHTAGLAIDKRAGRNTTIGVGIESDFADNYRSLLGRLQFNHAW